MTSAADGAPALTPRWRGSRAPLALLAILLVAAALRLWNVDWGLAIGEYFPDELIWVARSQVDLLSPVQVTPYPPAFGYLTRGATAALDALGVLRQTGAPRTGDLILVARGVSVATGVVGVAIVGVVGARLYRPAVGLVAAALLAVVPRDVVQPHYASLDGLLTAVFTLTILAAVGLARRGTPRRAASAGVLCGLAFATKYTGLSLLVPIGVAILEHGRRERSWRPVVRLGAWALTGLAAGVALGCPPCALHPQTILDAVRAHWRVQSSPDVFIGDHLEPSLGWYGHRYLYQVVASFPFMLGWPLYLLVLLGVGVAGWCRAVADRVILATIVPYFVVMAASPVTFARFLMPLVPSLVVLAARGTLALRIPGSARAALLGAAFLYALVLSASLVANWTLERQEQAAQWIAAARPDLVGGRASIAVPARYVDYLGLRNPFARAGLRLDPVKTGHWFDQPHDVFVLPQLHVVAIERDAAEHAAGAADLERLRSGAAGFREAKRWRAWFLDRRFYEWLDPGFTIGMSGGDVTVYVR